MCRGATRANLSPVHRMIERGSSVEDAGRFSQEPVRPPGRWPFLMHCHQRQETRSKQRGAGHRVVGVLLRDRPALPLGKGPTDPHLIGDGRVTLVVRRVARVDGDLHGWRASMNLCGVARPLRLEQLPRSLTGQHSDESAQMLVTLRVDLVVRVRANVRPMLSSPPLAPMPSSFGHDTPGLPMLNVDAGFACSFCFGWAALSAAPMHRRLTGEGPWQCGDVDSEVGRIWRSALRSERSPIGSRYPRTCCAITASASVSRSGSAPLGLNMSPPRTPRFRNAFTPCVQ